MSDDQPEQFAPLPPPTVARQPVVQTTPSSPARTSSPAGQRFPAGWYRDPTVAQHRGSQSWRWWNGVAWTAYRHVQQSKPLLPTWLSWPVLVCAVPVFALLVWLGLRAPFQSMAAVVPGLIAIPVFIWLDRVEPEPWVSRIHAVLWGATVAILVSGIVNSIVIVAVSESAGIVLSAPIVEETMKGLGVVVAVRRREIDSMGDAVIFAGLIAMGFAIVEDVEYFMSAGELSEFWIVFVLRGLLTPFAHPLFTIWTGLAVGREVSYGRGVNITAAWGLLVAIALHMAWNVTTVVAATELIAIEYVLMIVALFVVLFFSVAVALIVARIREKQRFDRAAPYLVRHYGLSDIECQWFSNFNVALAYRRRLPRRARKPFDAVRAAVARLAAVHERGGSAELEAVYASDLYTERRLLAEQTQHRTQ